MLIKKLRTYVTTRCARSLMKVIGEVIRNRFFSKMSEGRKMLAHSLFPASFFETDRS